MHAGFQGRFGLVFAAAGFLPILGLPGCASPVGQVDGTVTWDATPVAKAELIFESVANPTQQFFGVGLDDGRYVVGYRGLRGMPVGAYHVKISRHTLRDGAALPAGEAGEALKRTPRAVVQVYQFDTEIAAGPNRLDFDLKNGRRLPPPEPPPEP